MTAPPPPAPAIIEKAVCYITRDRRILVFEHPHVPAAGIQVPAGTIHPGEQHPSDGSPGPIEFRVFWADLCAGLPPISGELDALLPQVIDDCCHP